MGKYILCETSEEIASLVLNRPERHNSLIPELLEEMHDFLARIARAEDSRVLVISACGRSFSTGGDLRAFYEHRKNIGKYADRIVGLLNRVIVSMMKLQIPIILTVNGIVTGGAMGIVLASDIVLVSPKASFTPYYSEIGFSPDGGWTAILPEFIGIRRTTEILMFNLTIQAEQAVEWGIANQIIDDENLYEEAMHKARVLSTKYPQAIRSMKRLLSTDQAQIEQKLENERIAFIEQATKYEALEGIMNFLSR